MKKLFLVDGAAGFVKNDLVRYVYSKESAIIVTKKTTRKCRENEQKAGQTKKIVDLDFMTPDKFNKYVSENVAYCYNYGTENDGYGKARYAIPKKSLDEAIIQYENVFVIVRNSECINRITNDYCMHVKVVPVLIYADKQFVSKRLDDEGRGDEVDARLNRINEVLDDYYNKLNYFNRCVMINDSSYEHFIQQLNSLLDYYDQEDSEELFVTPKQSYKLIKPLIGYKRNLSRQIKNTDFNKMCFS